MGLNASGPISLGGSTVGQSVNLELGNAATTQISLGQSTVRSLAGVASGAISLDNLHGKSSTFSFNLTSGSNLNLRTQALSAGWDGNAYVIATIPSGNTIQSASTGSAALTIDGSFPAGVKLINQGTITGRGGNGGNGGNCSGSTTVAGSIGFAGGTALLVTISASVDNGSGVINGGGGGGGGGGAAYHAAKTYTYGCGGGGGGGGFGVSSGATGGSATGASANYPGGSGSGGTLTTNGGGGAGGNSGSNAYAGSGGSGGLTGSTGSTGGSGYSVSGNAKAGGSGGAAGSCTSGNANITWIATGTRNGPLN